MPPLLPTDCLRSERLKRLLADWTKRCPAHGFPARRDFDPIDLKYVLGRLTLLEVLRDPPNFKFRVHATEAAQYLGYDLTGRTLDDYPSPEYRDYTKRLYQEAVRSARPCVVQESAIIGGRALRWEALILPLTADGKTIDMLMVGLDFRRSG